ncbi:rad50 [Symbiodinium sp. CCMP2592]|nr:rad50 [Symbiodinium sp. CCMP2592]
MPALPSPYAKGGSIVSMPVVPAVPAGPVKSSSGKLESLRLAGVRVPSAPGQSWDQKLSEAREAALAKWLGILERFPEDFGLTLSIRLDRENGRGADLKTSLQDVFSQKASVTISGRAGPLARYVKHCRGRQVNPFPVTEAGVYAFLQDYASHEAPTFARSFLSSLAFAKFTVSLKVSDEVFSPRVRGLSSKLYLDKRKTRQKPALKVDHVRKLEAIASGSIDLEPADRVAAGFFVWTLYARARYSDAQAAGAMTCDLSDTPDGVVGYLEAAVERSKTSFSLERKVRYLHMFAPIQGIGEVPWGVKWFEFYKVHGPPLGTGKPLLPSPLSGGGWQTAPLAVASATKWMKSLLIRAGCDRSSVEPLGTHSLKATTLSWSAKFGLAREVRAALGYHARGRDGTEIIYGSSYFVKRFEDPEGMPIPPDEVLSDSSSEASEDAEDVDHEAAEAAADELGRQWEPDAGLRAELEAVPLFRNKDSRFIHAVASEEGDKFRCGRSRGDAVEKKEHADILHVTFKRIASRVLLLKMANYSESQSVLQSRLSVVGFAEGDVLKILPEVGNLRRLAFISSFTPGQTDEEPLMRVLKDTLKRDLTIADKANWRAVYNEAYAIVTAEMKQRIEKADPESTVRPLSQPERSKRYERQAKKLVGISLKGPLEPADALVDLAVASYEANELRYIPWDRCVSKEAELAGEKKRDVRFTVEESSGKLRIEHKQPDLVADTSSEILVQQALTRRSLAMDQANLIDFSFSVSDQWTQRLMKARMQTPAEHFVRPTWKQPESADRQLFAELRDKTRAGVQTVASGRPLDTLLPDAMYMNEVSCLLQPFPAPVLKDVPQKPDAPKWERPSPYTKGGGKGKKGKQRFMTRLPAGLEGCRSHTNRGDPICFAFNLVGCSTKGQKCEKGLHICAVPKCGAHNHGAAQCPKRAQGPHRWMIFEREFIGVDREDHHVHNVGSHSAIARPSPGVVEAARSRSPKPRDGAASQSGTASSSLDEGHVSATDVLRVFDGLPSDALKRGADAPLPTSKSYATGAYVANASANPEVEPSLWSMKTDGMYPTLMVPEALACRLQRALSDSMPDTIGTTPRNILTFSASVMLMFRNARPKDCFKATFSAGQTIRLAKLLLASDSHWSVLHPLASALWKQLDLPDSLHCVDFCAGCYGAPCPVKMRLCTTQAALAGMPVPACRCRPGPHAAGSLAPDVLYTPKFCDVFAGLLQLAVGQSGLLLEHAVPLQSSRHSAVAAAGRQPRLSKFQPQIAEFKCQATVREFPWPLPLDNKGNLTCAIGSIPPGSRLLRVVCDRGVVEQVGSLSGVPSAVTFGIYRTEHEFVAQALHIDHPFDLCVAVPDFMLRALAFTLKEGPVGVMKHRLNLLQQWTSWKRDLAGAEANLHAAMDPGVASVMKGKNILLLEKIASTFSWPDTEVFEHLKHGFPLVGESSPSGIFDVDRKPALMTRAELVQHAKFLRPALWAKVANAEVDDLAREVWDSTQQEMLVKEWLTGPYSWDELQARHPEGWLPVRRFGIVQKAKTRSIDDLAENSVNCAYAVSDRISLRALDELVWLAITLFKIFIAKGEVSIPLSDGDHLRFPVHSFWRALKPDALQPSLKTVDLKSAYKQLAASPRDRCLSIVAIKDPVSGLAFGFESRTLLFGATSSVVSFNRVARLLQRVLIALQVLACNYFDDYPVLEVLPLCNNTQSTIKAALDLLGFAWAEDKDLPFSHEAELLGQVLGVRVDLGSFGVVKIGNKPERATAIAEAVDSVLSVGHLDPKTLPSLFGRLQFAEGQLHGRLGRLALADLRACTMSSQAKALDATAAQALCNLRSRVLGGTPRIVPACVGSRRSVIFTDGAYEPTNETHPATVGGVLYHFDNGAWCTFFFACAIPLSVVQSWEALGKRHLIGPVEMYAVVCAREAWSKHLNMQRVTMYVDHSGVLASLVKGSSKDPLWRQLLLIFESCDAEANKVLSLDNKNPKKKHVIKEITPADVINVTSYLKKTNAYSEFYKNRRKGRSLEPVVSYVVRTCFEKEVAQESDLHQRIEVILDSGADDAQGKAIKTEGRRMLNLTFFDDNGSFCRIQEAFTVASVINPLMAIGKLFREGWELRVNEEEGMCLTDGSSRIPVHLHKNSLAAYAYVQTPSRSRGYSSSNYKMVRTVVQLNKHVQEAVNKEEPGWHNTDSMVIVKYATQSSYENPSLMYSPTHFPYRSTLVKEERGWRAVEVSRKYSEKADPFEEFGEGEKEVVTAISAKPIPLWILGTPYAAGDRADQESHGRDYWKMDLEKGEVVRHHVVPRTVLFDPTGVSNCPVLLGDLENSRYTQGDCIYSTEIYEHSDDWRADRLPLREHFRLPWFGQTRFRVKPGVVEDLKAEAAAEELKKKKEEHYQEKEDSAAPPAAEESKDEEMREAQADQEAPQEVVEVLEESFYHEGVEYTAQRSSLKELQALCREYGVKTTGSKKQLLKRLATAVREERLNTQHKEQREHHQAYHLAPPQEPTEEERAYHNLTHLPYQPWCPHCVAMKAREDNHKKGLSKPSSSTDSAKPVISFDFCYTSTTGSEEPPAVTLVAVDSWSKAVLAVPCKRKGGAGSTTHLAEALVQFTTLMMTPFWRNSEQVNHSQPQQKHLQHQLNQVNRAEETDGYLNMPHDDEVYEADDEFLYESEEEEEETESEPTEVFTKVPVEFFDEEKGPPNVDPDFLQKLDDEATVKEIKRLTKMGVISLVSTDPQEATENVPLVDSEQELHKWLTTKLVKDWRFREATGFEVDEATAGATKPKQIQRITKLVPMLALANNWAIYSVDVKVNYDVDSFDEAKKEVTEKAEKLKKVEESLEKEKEEFGNQKAEFEETVKRFLKKQKEVKDKEDKVTEREEKLEKDQETLQEQAKALSEKETALEEAEENVKAKEAEVEKKNKEAEKRERKAQERTVGYDQEREEYAKKYVDDVKKDLERELKVLKQEEKVRNQKLDDLQYDYKSLKDDYQYFKTYSQEVDALLLAAKDRIVKYKKKVKSLKETIGAVLSGSEGEEETDEAYKTKAEEEKEKAEAKAKEEEKKKGKKPKQVETEDPEEKPSSNQGDENTFDPNDIAEFTQLGYVWEFNKKTQEYRAKSEDKKGSTRIKNAPVKGRLLWNKVTECYRRHNVWFTDGKELDKFLETKENEKIEEEVQRRIHAKGKYDNQGMKGKGPSWDDGQNDSWWYNEQWNNENWNTTDDGSNWYENANPQNKGYWQTPEEWAQQNQWEQWTPKGKSKGKKSKNWVQTQ